MKNDNIDKDDKDYQIMELKQRISYYEPYKQKYEDLKEDWKYIKSLLDKEFSERTRLEKENKQLKQADNKIDMLQKRNRRLFFLEKVISQILPIEKQEELYDRLRLELVDDE